MLFSDLIQRDTRANQPAATAVSPGTLYYVTDENVTERSDGATWEDCSDGGGGGAPSGTGLVRVTAGVYDARAELSGDVTTSGALATTIANGAVTEAKQTLADNTTGNVTSSAHGYTPKSPADATKFLNGDTTPAFALVKDSDLSTSDNTTNDASTTKHGFMKKLPNDATKYYDGTGAFSTPTGGTTDLVIVHRNVSKTSPIYVTRASNSAFDVASPTKFTVRMWFMPLLGNNNNGLATRSSLSSSQGDWAFGFFNGASQRMTLRVNNNAASIQSSTTLPSGKWYFGEASYDSSLGSNNLKIFIDGNLDVQGNYSTPISNNAVQIVLGTYFDATTAFVGYISEFEFCANKIRNTSNYTPPDRITPDADTTIHWSFDEYIGAGITDDSGNGFNGTLAGNASALLETVYRRL